MGDHQVTFRAFADLPAPCLVWASAQAPAVALVPLAELPVAPAGIAEALGDWRAHAGRRWHLCGAVGGVMRRAGYSAAACEAVLRAWLPEGDPSVNVAHGVQHALGAWSKAADAVSGEAALAELLGAEHGALVVASVVQARWPRGAAALVQAAPTPPGAADDGDWDWNAPELPLDWYCRELAIATSERKITLIAGDPGAGKGPLANYLGVCFAFGLKAWGRFQCKACNVGILDFEGARLTARRVRSHVRGLGLDPALLDQRVFLRDCDPGLDATWIREWCEQRQIEVLIVDSYMSATAADAVDPNSPAFADFARELGALGICVIVIAHARKRPNGVGAVRPALGDLAGSFALAGMAQTAISVWNPDAEDTTLMRVACMRGPDGAFAAFDVQWSSDGTDEAPSWRAEIAGLATRASDEAARESDAERKRDAEQTDLARRVIAVMMLSPYAPRSKTAVASLTPLPHNNVSKYVGPMLGMLAVAGFVTADRQGRDDVFTLVLDDHGRPPRVRIVAGTAVADTSEASGPSAFAARRKAT